MAAVIVLVVRGEFVGMTKLPDKRRWPEVFHGSTLDF